MCIRDRSRPYGRNRDAAGSNSTRGASSHARARPVKRLFGPRTPLARPSGLVFVTFGRDQARLDPRERPVAAVERCLVASPDVLRARVCVGAPAGTAGRQRYQSATYTGCVRTTPHGRRPTRSCVAPRVPTGDNDATGQVGSSGQFGSEPIVAQRSVQQTDMTTQNGRAFN